MSAGVCEQSASLELSEEGKKRLEEITLVAFHHLLIEVVRNVTEQMNESAITMRRLQSIAAANIADGMIPK